MIARLVRPALLLVATAALGACTAYDSYGGTRVSVGYSSGGYYPYGSSYSRYPYYGWYDGFYYPGTGFYIYDSYGRRHRWNDRHRYYWEGRRGGYRDYRDNWDGYRRGRDGRYYDNDRRGDGRDWNRDGRGWDRDGRGRDRDGRGWRRDDNRGDYSRGRDGRRDDRNRGDYSRGRDGRGDGRTESRRSTPQVAQPAPQRPTRTESPRTSPREARSGRPSVDRGREFRRGNRD